MMTITQMSTVSGVSARTLRYYEEIGLFSPTKKSETGYRLYDDEALEVLRQILYFREMGIQLKTIKEILSNPALDKNQILKMQKRMLEAERKRIDKLIASIDEALKGADMDFTVFTREESTELFEAMLAHMPDEMRDTAIKEFGSIDNWREHYLDTVGKGKVQRQYEKIIEWYGGKDAYLGAEKYPLNQEIRESYQSHIDSILEKLFHRRDMDVDCFEVRELIGEYGFTLKQLLQLKQEREMMLSQARLYKDEQVQASTDAKYGEGFADFLSKAIISFYEE